MNFIELSVHDTMLLVAMIHEGKVVRCRGSDGDVQVLCFARRAFSSLSNSPSGALTLYRNNRDDSISLEDLQQVSEHVIEYIYVYRQREIYFFLI